MCDILPPDNCDILPVSLLDSTFNPSIGFAISNYQPSFVITAPLEESMYTGNGSLNVSPYSLETVITFGEGSDCDEWFTKSVENCKDNWSQNISWNNVIHMCGFSDPDGDYIYSQTVHISRKYELPSPAGPIYRTLQTSKELQFA